MYKCSKREYVRSKMLVENIYCYSYNNSKGVSVWLINYYVCDILWLVRWLLRFLNGRNRYKKKCIYYIYLLD